jgi:hypothetical protein
MLDTMYAPYLMVGREDAKVLNRKKTERPPLCFCNAHVLVRKIKGIVDK